MHSVPVAAIHGCLGYFNGLTGYLNSRFRKIAEIDLILWLGASRFYLWLALLIIATIYTIFLVYKLKTNK